MLNSRLRLPAALVLAAALAPGLALANYTAPASMNSGEEVPTNGSAGRAVGTVTIVNKSGSVPSDSVRVNLTYNSLTSNVTAAHIHGLAARGTNAGVLFTLTPSGGTAGSINNGFAISEQQKRDLLYGLMYLNIHTVGNGGGEIRGQIDSLNMASGKVPGASTNGLILLTLALAGTAVVVLSRRKLMA